MIWVKSNDSTNKKNKDIVYFVIRDRMSFDLKKCFGRSLANIERVLEYLMKYKMYLRWWFWSSTGFIGENDHEEVMNWIYITIVEYDACWIYSNLW